jgi:cytochrome P450
MAAVVGYLLAPSPDPQEADAGVSKAMTFLGGLLAAKQSAPGDDMATTLVTAPDMSDEERVLALAITIAASARQAAIRECTGSPRVRSTCGVPTSVHHCIGLSLGLAEVTVALAALFDAFPDLELAAPADSLEFLPGIVFSGKGRLPVRLRP